MIEFSALLCYNIEDYTGIYCHYCFRSVLLQTNVDSLKINYMDKGSGELVVLLHGWGSNIELFENMSELLARKYHVVAPDMPGFGLSDEPKEPWRVDDYVDFVLKFLEPFAPKKVTFLGHSFGGRVIIKMASRDLPFEIEKVILVDSAGVKPKRRRRRS